MNICVSLEKAKLLKENWWEKYTFMVFGDYSYSSKYELQVNEMEDDWEKWNDIYAPTAQELLDEFKKENIRVVIDIWRMNYAKIYNINGRIKFKVHVIDNNISNALADLWIWCKENGFITKNWEDE